VKSGLAYTITVPWRRACAVLPAIAMVFGGIAFDAQATPVRHMKSSVVAKDSAVIVVPDVAVTIPAGPSQIAVGAEAVTPVAPALVLPAGTVPGSSTPVDLDRAGIPVRALAGYRKAVVLIDPVDPRCHIDWALLAAIGRVESDHGRFGGNQLDVAGVARPGIIGIALDGANGTARITDTDGGLMDRDTVYDRAVGPMQFLPGTWRAVGTDADGDRLKNPQDIADAATAAAIYLCSGHADLSGPAGLRAAIMRYNASDSYVRTVTAIADAYRRGVTALPASALPVSRPSPAHSARSAVAVMASRRRVTAAPVRPGSVPASVLRPRPTANPGPPTPNPSTSVTVVPAPVTTTPAQTATVSPTLPVPADTCLVLPTETATAFPSATVPAVTAPCPSPTTSSPSAVPTVAP